MKSPVRFGVLGYAGIAKKHLIPAMLEANNAVPYAIASRSEEKLEEAVSQFGFKKAYSSYEELLADPDVDAVYIPLPNGLHKEWTIKAAKAGKHVLCEKPLALTEEDCLEMIEACREHGVQLMEAFMYRFTTRIAKLKELLASGVIGEVKHIGSTWRFVLTDNKNVRVSEELGGGSLRDVGCYPVNLIGMILQDEPISICAQKVTFQGVDLALSAVLKYNNDILCTISSGFNSQSTILTEINGTQGSLVLRDTFDQTNTPILLVKDGVTTEIPVQACKRYVLQIEAFSKALLDGSEMPLSLDETVRNNRLIQRILQAAED